MMTNGTYKTVSPGVKNKVYATVSTHLGQPYVDHIRRIVDNNVVEGDDILVDEGEISSQDITDTSLGDIGMEMDAIPSSSSAEQAQASGSIGVSQQIALSAHNNATVDATSIVVTLNQDIGKTQFDGFTGFIEPIFVDTFPPIIETWTSVEILKIKKRGEKKGWRLTFKQPGMYDFIFESQLQYRERTVGKTTYPMVPFELMRYNQLFKINTWE